MVALMNTPGLARLCVSYDATALRLRIGLGTSVLVDEILNTRGRQRIGTVVADYVLGLDENPLTEHPERLPLRLIGDGHSSRYHDEEAGWVTMHGRGSLQAVQAAVRIEVSELRFRSNVAVGGLTAWEEQSWVGGRVRVGVVEFDVVHSKTRCLATHANPITGVRDMAILTTLTQKLGQEKPTFGVAMQPTGEGGKIRVGDRVTPI